jgi:hypothetical protein
VLQIVGLDAAVVCCVRVRSCEALSDASDSS